jgi:hypothetical protein
MPRAADDFPAIRARMEELRWGRAGASADDDDRARMARALTPSAAGRAPATGRDSRRSCAARC